MPSCSRSWQHSVACVADAFAAVEQMANRPFECDVAVAAAAAVVG